MITGAKVVKPYVMAVFQDIENLEDAKDWLGRLQVLRQALLDEGVCRLLTDKTVSKYKKTAVIKELLHGLVDNKAIALLDVLGENNRLLFMGDLFSVFMREYYSYIKVFSMRVFTSQQLSSAQTEQITNSLAGSEFVGNKQVNISWNIDESLIAGVKIDFDGRIINSSIAQQLKTLYEHLITTK